MTDVAASADADVELLPGYYVEPATGAWLTLPWPADLAELPPSLAPQIFQWVAGEETFTTPWLGAPRIVHHLHGTPWQFTPAQMRFLHLWYAVRDDGRWLYRSGVKRGAKGTGKDPFAASLCIIEAVGPVRFDGFEHGHPIGVPPRMSLVQIAANSKDQAGDVLRVLNGQISDALKSEHHVDDGITRTIIGGGFVELLTASQKSSEGDPADAIILNETHHMTQSSGGMAVAAVARRNVAKSPGGHARLLELTNAHMPGEGSVAEEAFEAWQKQAAGLTRRKDILYDSREAAPHLRLHVEEELEQGITQAYFDSPWNDRERIRDEAQDPRVPAADSIRFYFNALPTNEMAWTEPRRFAALGRQRAVPDGSPIATFLDCSKSDDATAYVGCEIESGHRFTLGMWQRPHGDLGTGWLAPREEVDAVVRAVHERWAVQWFGVDPSPALDDDTEALYWAPTIDGWHRDFHRKLLLWATPGQRGSSVLFDMRLSQSGGVERNRAFTEAAMQAAQDIDEWNGQGAPPLTHDGDPRLVLHVNHARRRPNHWGVSLGKRTRDSSDKVDLAVAMVGAGLGRRIVLNSGKPLRRAGVQQSKVTVLR